MGSGSGYRAGSDVGPAAEGSSLGSVTTEQDAKLWVAASLWRTGGDGWLSLILWSMDLVITGDNGSMGSAVKRLANPQGLTR